MKTPKRPTKRPGILVRFYPSDLQSLNRYCQNACTPRENFIRRCVIDVINAGTAAARDRQRAATQHRKSTTTKGATK